MAKRHILVDTPPSINNSRYQGLLIGIYVYFAKRTQGLLYNVQSIVRGVILVMAIFH